MNSVAGIIHVPLKSQVLIYFGTKIFGIGGEWYINACTSQLEVAGNQLCRLPKHDKFGLLAVENQALVR